MSKLLQKNNQNNRGVILDTLVLHDHAQCLQGFQPIKKDKKTLLKRAKNNYFSKQLAKNLMYLDSKLNKAYKRTYFDCCSTIVQEGKKITSRYCNARWCNVCNRIRTAKLCNGYLKPLETLKKPYFVTLTIPNVNKADLKLSIKQMLSCSINSIRTIKRKGMPFNAIRKLECTYNHETDTYHPHFHYIVDTEESANELLNQWLLRNPNASIKAQHITKANINSIKELFKYQTKIVSKANHDFNIYISPLDTIFKAIKGMRTFQAFGMIKKVNEDISELDSELYEDIEEYEFVVWLWNGNDWVNMVNGSMLSGYKPSNRMIELTTTKMVT